jgi:hypothetical protein
MHPCNKEPMRMILVRRSGWNTAAMLAGPFWYIYKRMVGKGAFMLMLSLATAGIGIIPVWIYCGFKGNSDFYRYLKHKGIYIYE